MKWVVSLIVSLLGSLALADAAPAAAPRDGVTPFIPLLMIFGVFYFLILRPQQKKQKEQLKFISELKRGDMVITQAGIIGTVKTVSDKFVTLEVDENVHLKVLKSQIAESATTLKESKIASTKEVTA
ncbi:MAG: preprotein translocase subunit YajC [Proteobacteria bacterium]|nr:preprotein translocase subunit YajC [Pseudomonadota bacterium]